MPAIRLGSGEGLSNLTLGVERGPELLLRSSDLRTRDSPPPPPHRQPWEKGPSQGQGTLRAVVCSSPLTADPS